MLTPPPEPPVTAHLLLVGGSLGWAIAFAEQQHFGPGEWVWVPAPGPLRVFSLHEQGTRAAQHILPRRPSEALDEHRAQVIAALRGLGVSAAAVAWGSEINLLVTFAPPQPKGLDWVGRIMQVEEAVFKITGFPCDAAGLTCSGAPRIPLFGSP